MAKIHNDLPKMSILSSSSCDSSSEEEIIYRSGKKTLKCSPATPRQKPQNKENGGLIRVLTEKKEDKPVKTFNIYSRQIGKFYGKRKHVNKVVPLATVVDVDKFSDNSDEDFSTVKKEIKPSPKKKKSRSTLESTLESPVTVKNGAKRQTRSQTKMPETTLDSPGLEDFDVEEIKGESNSPLKPNDKNFLSSLNDNMNFFDDVIDLDEGSPEVEENIEERVTVRISCATKCEKFQMRLDQEFRTILEDLSKILGVKESDITLYLGFDVIHLHDTPLSINIRPSDKIICSTSSGNGQAVPESAESGDLNVIYLQLQSNIERKKFTFKCHKNKPLRDLVEAFATERNIDAKRVNLKLDGDLVNLDETAAECDLETGDCIDVLVK